MGLPYQEIYIPVRETLSDDLFVIYIYFSNCFCSTDIASVKETLAYIRSIINILLPGSPVCRQRNGEGIPAIINPAIIGERGLYLGQYISIYLAIV